jgi:hypothetical protein
MCQRFFLRQFLDRDRAAEFTLDSARDHADGNFVPPPVEREKFSADLALLEEQLRLLTELGKLLSANPAPPLQKRFLSAVRRLSVIFENSARFEALGFLWQAQVQEQGGELPKALLCVRQYHSLIRGLKSFLLPEACRN